MVQTAKHGRFSFGAMLAALFIGLCATFSTAAPAMAQSREGASFIAGEWRITGSYSDGSSGINFTVNFSSDGTFVDRDGYRGRWLITGSSFAMFYPDDSQLGYAGVISGSSVSGRFDGANTAGNFSMSRSSGGGSSGGGSSAALVGGTWRLEGGSWGVGYFDFYSNGRFDSPGTAGGSWSQSGNSVYFRFDEPPHSTFSGTVSGGSASGNVTWEGGADSFRMTRQ